MATGYNEYHEQYHFTRKGDVIMTRDGKLIGKTTPLTDHTDLIKVDPEAYFNGTMTRSASYIFKHCNPRPYDPKEDDLLVRSTQAAMDQMTEMLTKVEMHSDNYELLTDLLLSLKDNPTVPYAPPTDDKVTTLTEQLKDKDIEMMNKDTEILRLKAQLEEQERNKITTLVDMKNHQESMQKAMKENYEKQQKEFKEQMRKFEEQKNTGIEQLQTQLAYLKTTLMNKTEPIDNPYNPTPTPTGVDNFLLKEFTEQMKQQNHINIQNQLSLAPSYDGKEPTQFNTWLDNVERLAKQSREPEENVALHTSRGSLHRFIQDQKTLNLTWLEIIPKLREIYSDCTSPAAAQSKLASIKQNGKSLHEYIENFTKLLHQAHNRNPKDFGTDMLACRFIEGIDATNQHMRYKLRQLSGKTLDEYFQEALSLQKGQELRSLDYGPKQESDTCDVNAIRSNNFNCFTCGSPQHFAKDCPDQNKQQQSTSHNNQQQYNTFRSNLQQQSQSYNSYSRQNPQSQSQSSNRQTSSLEQAIESLTKALYNFKTNPYNQSKDKPRQPFQNNRQNSQGKPRFRNFDNKQKFKNNYHKQSTHVNEIEGFEEMEPQHDSDYDQEQEDLIEMDPSETFEKN